MIVNNDVCALDAFLGAQCHQSNVPRAASDKINFPAAFFTHAPLPSRSLVRRLVLESSAILPPPIFLHPCSLPPPQPRRELSRQDQKFARVFSLSCPRSWQKHRPADCNPRSVNAKTRAQLAGQGAY